MGVSLSRAGFATLSAGFEALFGIQNVSNGVTNPVALGSFREGVVGAHGEVIGSQMRKTAVVAVFLYQFSANA